MSDLTELVLKAHGGLPRWQQATTIHAKGTIGGDLWATVGQEGILASADLTVDVQRQRTVFAEFTSPELRGLFTPDRVALLGKNDVIVTERTAPRESFTGLSQSASWDELHALYFAGYAMWNYLTTPYLLTRPGVVLEELAPWPEPHEDWRRLRATFPGDIATHCVDQTFYFDSAGLLRRHDYAPDVLGGTPAAHFTEKHLTTSGLVFPTHRYVVPAQEDGRALREPILISIELSELSVT
ncbi:hypothetical protein EAO75_14925 [Streptomyces sp. uw30]|uniref:hypothetical protein n=1 Tax=Streptomyces sp. uw30 TaxID=1828179 RepID=UPI0011CDA7E7|nr:hypothetical protein [Streptomyces sp. uw30]TXS49045.1 hypothetical protein EAO75_14925 [Streptomyces sp. uw30]